jgi:hypothetical protein
MPMKAFQKQRKKETKYNRDESDSTTKQKKTQEFQPKN